MAWHCSSAGTAIPPLNVECTNIPSIISPSISSEECQYDALNLKEDSNDEGFQGKRKEVAKVRNSPRKPLQVRAASNLRSPYLVNWSLASLKNIEKAVVDYVWDEIAEKLWDNINYDLSLFIAMLIYYYYLCICRKIICYMYS